MTGFNPDALVARGVFDSREELDRVMCELDDARPGPTVSRLGWGLGMDFNRARVGSGVAGVSPSPFGTGGAAAVTAPAAGKPAALCIFCAWERAMQPGPWTAPPRINGDVMLWPCARHASQSSSSAGTNGQQQPHTPAA